MLHEENQGHDHEADQEEGDKRPQVSPGHPAAVAQTAERALSPRVRGVTGRVRSWGPV